MEENGINEIENYYTYNDYRDLVIHQANTKNCTGVSSPEHIAATIINAQRMIRIDKQCTINIDLKKVIASLPKKYTWLLLTESWCGDGAQCVPVIAKMADLNPNITLKLALRDEHPSLMDAFLTNGSRSIPKLIFISEGQIIDTWGPRPKLIQEMVVEFKQANPDISHEEFARNLHLWYARDKTQSIQKEFEEILKQH